MFDDLFPNEEQRKKNSQLLKDIELLGEILKIYQGVINAMQAVPEQKLRKKLEDYVTS